MILQFQIFSFAQLNSTQFTGNVRQPHSSTEDFHLNLVGLVSAWDKSKTSNRVVETPEPESNGVNWHWKRNPHHPQCQTVWFWLLFEYYLPFWRLGKLIFWSYLPVTLLFYSIRQGVCIIDPHGDLKKMPCPSSIAKLCGLHHHGILSVCR